MDTQRGFREISDSNYFLPRETNTTRGRPVVHKFLLTLQYLGSNSFQIHLEMSHLRMYKMIEKNK